MSSRITSLLLFSTSDVSSVRRGRSVFGRVNIDREDNRGGRGGKFTVIRHLRHTRVPDSPRRCRSRGGTPSEGRVEKDGKEESHPEQERVRECLEGRQEKPDISHGSSDF